MGMTNLSWPEADKMIARESAYNNIPTCVSMASSKLGRYVNFSKVIHGCKFIFFKMRNL